MSAMLYVAVRVDGGFEVLRPDQPWNSGPVFTRREDAQRAADLANAAYLHGVWAHVTAVSVDQAKERDRHRGVALRLTGASA